MVDLLGRHRDFDPLWFNQQPKPVQDRVMKWIHRVFGIKPEECAGFSITWRAGGYQCVAHQYELGEDGHGILFANGQAKTKEVHIFVRDIPKELH